MFRISQEELADRPGLEGLRKRLLWSVLAFYQEFLEERRDDEQARTDLVDAKQRVEKILADLAVLRAASQLYLLCQPAVLDDLRADDVQRPKIMDFCVRVGKEWMESFGEVGRLSPTERGRRAIERAKAYEVEINSLLTPAQKFRLRHWRARGCRPTAAHDAAARADPNDRGRGIVWLDEKSTTCRRARRHWSGPGTAGQVAE
jgi:hypothetical protein